jgi:hypothetical protein
VKLVLESLIFRLWFIFGTVKTTLEVEGLEGWVGVDQVGEEAVEEAIDPKMITGEERRE